MRYTTDALHACLLGGWTSSLMYRRQLMSLHSSNAKVLPLPRSVSQELLLLSIFAPLMCSDLSAVLGDHVFCTDSSDAKGAVVSTPVPVELSRYFWRVGSKKGGYARLLTKQEALVHKMSSAGLLEDDADKSYGFDGLAPKKSPLLRFDFIEICGGASKVSRELSKLGWVIGPCLDLDSSVHFNLSSFDLLRWVVCLLESRLLDGLMVQPPCTTFSPAQHPALRSYILTRGYRPTEPRTLLGTVLALHGFSLMFGASRVGAIGVLEQSRRSKMCWMPEWKRFLENGWAHEEWYASCACGSKHKKEFRFLITNLESSELHRKSHPHQD